MKTFVKNLPGLLVLLVIGCGGESTTDDTASSTANGSADPAAAAPPAEQSDIDIWTAISTGNIQVVKQHLDAGTDPNIKDNTPNGAPILNAAAVYGHRGAVEALIQKGADINGKDSEGNGALHAAAFLGRSEIVELLLEKGVDANVKNAKGETPMNSLKVDWETTQAILGFLKIEASQQTVMAGRTKSSELLTKRGGKIGTGDGGSGLVGAVRRQDVAAVKKMLDESANLDAPGSEFGITPLNWAALLGNVEIAGMLIDKGANVNGPNRDDGTRPLHSAAFLGHTPVVELLLSKKADPNIKNKRGETPINSAQSDPGAIQFVAGLLRIEVNADAASQGRPKCIALLEKSGAKSPTGGSGGLVAAVRKQDVEAVKQALAKGADPNVRDPQTKVPVVGFAAIQGNVEIARLLIDKGADVNAKNDDKNTPLHGAAWLGHAAMVELLLNSGANPNAENNEGQIAQDSAQGPLEGLPLIAGIFQLKIDAQTVQQGRPRCLELLKNGTGAKELAAAIRKQDVAAVKALLAKNTSPNIQDSQLGITALSWAAFHGNLEIVQLLVARKANVNGRNRDGSRPLHAAAFTGRPQIIELLLGKGADPTATSNNGETPLKSTSADEATTKVAAGFLGLTLDPGKVKEGRAKCIELLKKAPAPESAKSVKTEWSPESAARSLLVMLTKDQFDEAAETFGDAVKAALPAAKLKETWQTVQIQAGKYQGVDEKAKVQSVGPHKIVDLLCTFEKSKLIVRTAYDDKQKVAGFFFLPAPAQKP